MPALRPAARGDRPCAAWYDDRHQCRVGARRCGYRDDHHCRLSRYRPHRTPPTTAALFDPPGNSLARSAAGPAPSSADGRRAAGTAARRGTGAARRGGRAGGGSSTARRRRRGDRRLLPVLVFERCARETGARNRARGIPGLLHLHLGRGGAAIPRVREVYHGFAQRLRRAPVARLRSAAGRAVSAAKASRPICT